MSDQEASCLRMISDTLCRDRDHMRRVAELEAKLLSAERERDAASRVITEAIRALNKGEPIQLRDEWGDSAVALPKET